MNRIKKAVLISVSVIIIFGTVGWVLAPVALDTTVERTFEQWNGKTEVGEFNYLVVGEYFSKDSSVIVINTSYGSIQVLTDMNGTRGYRECSHNRGDTVRYGIFSNSRYYKPVEFYLKRELC